MNSHGGRMWPLSTLPKDEPEPPKRKRKIKPKSLTLAWTGGRWGMRPTLLGRVPEGTTREEVAFGDYSDQVTVGTLEEFVAACMFPGTEDY